MKALFAEGSNGTVYFDGESITVTKTGLWNKLSGNSGRTTIPVELVERIEWMPPKLGKGAGFILFVRADDPMAELRYRNYGRKDNYATANADPLGCSFGRNQAEDFVEIRNAVRDKIHVEVVDVSNDPDEFVEPVQTMDFTTVRPVEPDDDEPSGAATTASADEMLAGDDSEGTTDTTQTDNGSSTYNEQLRMLTKLLRDGILTVDEFEAKLRLLDENV